MARLLKLLRNPFVLAGQGFLAGALIFSATHARSPESGLAGVAAAGMQLPDDGQR